MQRGKHVKPIRLDKRRRLRAESRCELRAGTCARVNRLDKSRIFDGHVDQPAFGVEEGGVWPSGKGPFAPYPSGPDVNFDKQPGIAGHIKKVCLMVDVHPVGTDGRKRPVLHRVQFWQSGNQDHGRVADGQEHPLRFRIDDAPVRPSGKVNGPSPISLQSENLELGGVGVVPDASDDRNLQR